MNGIEYMVQHQHQEAASTPEALLEEMGEDMSKIYCMLVKDIQPDESGWSPLSIRLSQYMDLYGKVKRAAGDPDSSMTLWEKDKMIDIMNHHKLEYNDWWHSF